MSTDARAVCKKFMQDPHEIRVDEESKLTLHGLLQYYAKISEREKNRKLNDLLDALEFNQVVIFVKSVQRAVALDKLLCECNFPSIAIHSALDQEDRIARYKQFKEFQKRIMVSTDLFGRGIDIERVNIVINYDMPDDSDSYLHRVGRAGRFGTKGGTSVAGRIPCGDFFVLFLSVHKEHRHDQEERRVGDLAIPVFERTQHLRLRGAGRVRRRRSGSWARPADHQGG